MMELESWLGTMFGGDERHFGHLVTWIRAISGVCTSWGSVSELDMAALGKEGLCSGALVYRHIGGIHFDA